MDIKTQPYSTLVSHFPPSGNHILACYDDSDILVYVPQIGEFYGDKTVSRPVWITPSFMWIMHDSEWLEAENYNSIECMIIKRSAFEEFIADAVSDTFDPKQHGSEDDWQKQKANSTVMYRWKADYSPEGEELSRNVLQLGIHSRRWMQSVMRGDIVAYNEIDEDLFTQKDLTQPPYDGLVMPIERPYPMTDDLKPILHIED